MSLFNEKRRQHYGFEVPADYAVPDEIFIPFTVHLDEISFCHVYLNGQKLAEGVHWELAAPETIQLHFLLETEDYVEIIYQRY